MSFLSAVGGFFKKLFNTAPQWTIIASTAVKFALPAALGLMQVIDPHESPEAVNIAGEINSDLALVGTLLSQMHGNPDQSKVSQIQTTLSAVNQSMASLLSAGHIKNPGTVGKVEAISSIVTGEVNAILSVIPSTGTSPAPISGGVSGAPAFK